MKQRVGRSKQMVLSQLRASLAAFGPPPTPGSREAATPRDAAPATPDYELILERYKFLLELGEEMPEDLVAMVTPRPACRRPCSLGCVFTPMLWFAGQSSSDGLKRTPGCI